MKELFHAALERAPGERTVFLQTACGGDDAMRREIERLLAAHQEAGDFIEESPLSSFAPLRDSWPSMTGRIMGHYEVGRLIGSGGMGAVYAAHDIELGRVVALKIVTGNDVEAQTRLRHEAQRASKLNHPHVCTIHEVGTSDGQAFFAMEYVEGQTLSEMISRRVFPLEAALRYGIQIADALAHAHGHGIVHRDLKSANVVVTPDGRAKVLDFGLACDVPVQRISELSQSKGALAGEGLVAGTLPYMAPQLLRGDPADARSDIWALGVLLYEMVCGRRPFEGTTGFELSAAILYEQPSPFPDRTPASLQEIIRRCLAKDRHDRYAHAGEVRSAMEAVKTETAARTVSTAIVPAAAQIEIARRIEQGAPDSLSGLIPAAMPPRSRRRRAFPWMVAALAMAAVAAWWWLGRSSAPEAAWSAFTQLTDASGIESGPSISPGGDSFAYSSPATGSWDIYVQRVGGRNPMLVAGDPTRDEVWPAFSPDGKQIAFNIGGGTGGIFVVGATGESARRLTDFGSNPAWSPDGQRIVFCTEEVRTAYNTFTESTLWSVDVNGGTPTKLEVGVAAFQPASSPSGKRIAFWTNTNGQRDLGTIAAAGGQRVMVTSDAAVDWAPVWSPDGRFLYFASDRGGSMGIWRIPLDESSGRATGPPEAIAAGVDVAMDLPHLSADGSALVFRSMIQSVNPAAIDFDPATERAGDARLLLHRTGLLMPTDVSPDGRWIALTNVFDRQQDLFAMRSDGTGLSRLTDDLARDWQPRFTPDGMALVFSSTKSGTYDAWSIRLDGSGRTRLTAIPDAEVAQTMFAPDGRRLFAVLLTGDIVIGSAPWPITRQSGRVIKAQAVGGGTLFPRYWSRNGRWLVGPVVLASGEPRGNALYDIALGTVRQLSDDAVSGDIAWMPDGRVIYFAKSGKLVIQNLVTLARHDIPVTLPLPPDDVWSIAAAPDGRTLYYGAQLIEANIWKVERVSPRNRKP